MSDEPETAYIDAKSLPRILVKLEELENAARNANRMPVHKYQALRKFIKRNGLAQELVVFKRDDGEWEIVDGHHRAQVLRELWDPCSMVPCLDASELSPVERVELTLSLNNNRGELDLSGVSLEVDFLLEQGRELEDLDVTGFTLEELEALAGATADIDEEDLLADALDTEHNRNDDVAPKVFVLELTLASAKELRLAKSRLRKAGGKGNKDLTKGFRSWAGLDEDDR